MIFFLIAGTATPAFLLDAPGAFGLACLIVLWTLTLTAAAIHLAWMGAPELLVGATFVGLGWAGQPALRCRGCGSMPASRPSPWPDCGIFCPMSRYSFVLLPREPAPHPRPLPAGPRRG